MPRMQIAVAVKDKELRPDRQLFNRLLHKRQLAECEKSRAIRHRDIAVRGDCFQLLPCLCIEDNNAADRMFNAFRRIPVCKIDTRNRLYRRKIAAVGQRNFFTQRKLLRGKLRLRRFCQNRIHISSPVSAQFLTPMTLTSSSFPICAGVP